MNKKIFTEKQVVRKEKISEDEIKKLIRKISWDKSYKIQHFSENELIYEIISLIKCDLEHAKAIIEGMNNLGLVICTGTWEVSFKYDLWKFAFMRDYISQEEYFQHLSELSEQQERRAENERKFMKKHGSDKTEWSEEIWEKYWWLDFDEE